MGSSGAGITYSVQKHLEHTCELLFCEAIGKHKTAVMLSSVFSNDPEKVI